MFLKNYRKDFVLLLVCSLVFALVFALYHLPVAAVGYGLAICIALGGALAAIDYGKFRKKRRRMEYLKKKILTTLDTLPEPETPLEADYQELLRILYQEKGRLQDTLENQYDDMVDYYTIWAHQIKTPIAAMRLILQGGAGSARGSEGQTGETSSVNPFSERQELSEELLRIEQYVEMALCYLRLDAGSTDYVIREYELDDILRQAIRRQASFFIRKKIRLEYEPVGVRVITDEKWLLFVMDQLLSNALKYTAAGTISITLERGKTLCIRDTGIGIAPEDLPRIFEKGYTGYNGRTDKKASGIGLYLCRRICANLGHRIRITSALGEGTQVWLDLENERLEVE